MKKTLLALSVILALSGAASAQFAFKTAEGKTIGSKVAPTFRTFYRKTSDGALLPLDDVYLTWEKERVKVVQVGLGDDEKTIRGVLEFFFYYDLLNSKEIQWEERSSGVGLTCWFKGAKRIPYYSYHKDWTHGRMDDRLTLEFPDKKVAEAFLKKVEEKQLDLSLDLDYQPRARLAFHEDYRFPPHDAAPAPVIVADEKPAASETPKSAPAAPSAPKKREEVSVKLYNKSNNPIELIVKDYPKGSGGTIFTLNSRNSRRYTIRVGGEVRVKATGAVLLSVTEAMHDTEQVIAR